MSSKPDDILKIAVGKWPSILVSLGVPEKAVSGKHSPCPLCEGKDRFRMIEVSGNGRWICNQCGSGDGMNLAMAFTGLSFNDICNKIRPYVPQASYAEFPKKPDVAEMKRRMHQLMGIWRSAKDQEIVRRYLTGIRGLPSAAWKGADLRGGMLKYFDEEGNFVEKRPTMIARVVSPAGRAVCLHRTFIEGDSAWDKKLTVTTGDWIGGAIRLYRLEKEHDTLIVAEGIETALAARFMHHKKNGVWLPAWATVSANGMKQFTPPDQIKHLLIMSDNDRNFTGQCAAYELGNKMVIHKKIQASVFVPNIVGNDWHDVLDMKLNG